MKRGEFTSAALDRAIHPLCQRGAIDIIAVLAADGLYEEALSLAGQLTASTTSKPEHLYWMAFGAERLLMSLVQSRNLRRRRRRVPPSRVPPTSTHA